MRVLTAEALASLNMRSISTGPLPDLAVALARPLSRARAAASASMGVGLAPLARRAGRLLAEISGVPCAGPTAT